MRHKSPQKLLCLSVYPETGPSVRYRVAIYQNIWADAGVSLTIHAFMTQRFYRRRRTFGRLATLYKVLAFVFCTLRLIIRIPTVVRYDAVIIHREAFPLGPAVFEWLVTKLNRNVIYDLDDALWAPISLPVNQRKYFWSADRFAKAMTACRSVVAGNEYLADYCRNFNSDVRIIPTPYEDLGGKPSESGVEKNLPIIVWIGNEGNEDYLKEIYKPLQHLAGAHQFILRLIGGPAIVDTKISGVNIEPLVWNKASERDWLTGSSIGIMPLLNEPYEKGKCAFKLIQYFSAGLPVVASPVGANCNIVKHNKNGYLASTQQEWVKHLGHLLIRPDERVRLGKAGYQTWKAGYTPELNGKIWLELITKPN